MGIKGLKKYLESNPALHIGTPIPGNSHLHIDAYGWMFYLMQTPAGLEISRQFGGSYIALDTLVRDSYVFLLSCGLKLTFYFDGRDIPMKRITRTERNKKRVNSQAAIHDAITYVSETKLDQALLDLPPLTKLQYIHTLKSLKANIVDCKYEADQEMVLACKRANDQEPNAHYCYGDDTDYLAMADCLYITFESISRSKIPAQVDIVVWSRKNLARAMDMTETQFVEWCILIGNDYTAHFKRNLFNEYHEFSVKCGNYDTAVNSPGLVLSRLFIISKGPDYHLSSSNCNLERAITYSRAVYNLSDLSEYDMEIEDSEVKQVAILPEDESCSDTFKLSKEQKKCFDDWMESNDTDLSTGMQVTQFLQENLRKFAKFEELGMSQNVNLFPEILVLHLDVLNVMLKSICTKKSGKESQEPDDRHKKLAGYRTTQLKTALNVRGSNKCIGEYGTAIGKTDIIWRNAVAANTYQLLCKIVIQSEKHRVGNQPSDVYDGEIFHFAFQQIKSELEKSARVAAQRVAANFEAPRTEGPSPPRRETRCEDPGRVEKRVNNLVDKISAANSMQLAKKRKALSKLSNQLHGVRMELKKFTGVQLSPIGIALKAALVERRRSLRILAAEAIKALEQFKATLPLGSVSKRPVAHPATLHPHAGRGPVAVPSAKPSEPAAPGTEKLPIDDYRVEILRRVADRRISVIGGETGCGKSSRIPVMLLEDAERKGIPCRIMVSQPRRIAASSLMTRLRLTLGGKVGLRMGEGIRDETKETVISFVTCGYMVRLMSHSPKSLEHFTHIIIDEVHERSVDGDIACMLSKSLLQRYPNLRLVLMSATLNTGLYRNYFKDLVRSSDLEPLFVGVKRFNIAFRHCEDILSDYKREFAPKAHQEEVQKLISLTSNVKSSRKDKVPFGLFGHQRQLVLQLVKAVGRIGSDILIFVSGLGDIKLLYEDFSKFNKYHLCCIHSDIPYEEQRKAFEPALNGKIKLIIANNSAVSSVTFPDVDTVIDLGTHKCIQYSNMSHRSTLRDLWISKATATQRAGRTGRVRDGTVYRLYSSKASKGFDDFDEPEIASLSLDNVILDIWAMMEDSTEFDSIITTLDNLPEPPHEDSVYNSLSSLESYGMITEDTGMGSLTSLGRFSGALPLDLNLGMLITYGIALGVGAESVVFAAALSTNSSLMRQTNLLMMDHPGDFNDTIKKSFLGAVQLDNGSHSEPIMALNMYKKWVSLRSEERVRWCKASAIRHDNMSHFVTSVENILRSVNNLLRRGKRSQGDHKKSGETTEPQLNQDALRIEHTTTPRELNLYRLILTWVCSKNIMHQNTASDNPDWKARINIVESTFSVQDLEKLFIGASTISVKNDKKITNGALTVPVTIKFTGSTTFEGVLERDKNETAPLIRDLIFSFLDTATEEKSDILPIVCIVRETERNPAQFDISETDLERKSSTSTLTLAYPSDIDTPDWLIQLFNYFSEKLQKPRWLSDTLNELEDEYVFEDDSENVFRKYVVVEAFGVTKKQLMALSRLHDQSYPIATMSIPTAGMAKIAIFDFFPSQQSVLRVLDPYATEGDERQIVVKKLATLSFPESLTEGCVTGPTQLLSSSAPAASQRNDYNDLASAALDLLNPASEPAREIKDAPLGLRLLNAYCTAHTDSILRILAKEDLDTSIARWAGGRETSVKIPVGSEKGSWCRLYHELGVIPVYFPRHSVPAAAIHTGPEVLRAVAFTSLISFSRLGKAVCMAGGVTILPPGEKWLDLALSCVGAREPRDEDNSEFLACEIVETFLTGLRSSPVRREEALIHAIDYIFMDWLEESNQHK